MMKLSVILVFGFLTIAFLSMQTPTTVGQSPFRKAMQKKHNLKSVSCYTCHMKKKDVPEDQRAAFKKNSKSFRNTFGNEIAKLLKGKDTSKKLKGVKKLKAGDPKKVKVTAEVTADFLEALEMVEKMKSPDGDTYGDLIKSAKLSGVKGR